MTGSSHQMSKHSNHVKKPECYAHGADASLPSGCQPFPMTALVSSNPSYINSTILHKNNMKTRRVSPLLDSVKPFSKMKCFHRKPLRPVMSLHFHARNFRFRIFGRQKNMLVVTKHISIVHLRRPPRLLRIELTS